AEGFLARLESGSFMTGMLRIFQAKPGVIGGFATSLCLLLLISVVMTDRPDESASLGDLGGMQTAANSSQPMGSVALLPAVDSGISVSTNPIVSLQPAATLFSSQQNPLFQPASFVTSGQ
ncbi:MAG TPA: hypothetical protein VH251_06350, partial [Verrucomicrobiae bacterium]|nr:hypothetical protein [Verrucomicrobiae bacterium]